MCEQKNDKKLISVIIPMYNEEKSLPFLYTRISEVFNKLQEYNLELLFVNDGSKDSSLNIVKSLKENDNRIKYIDLSRNFGKEIAMIAGLDYALGDASIIIDADLQDPPELIIEMIKYYEDGYDDVYAKRLDRKGETFLKKITSKIYYKILSKFSAVEIQKDTGDFRLLSKKAVKSLKQLREHQRYTKGLFSLIGHKKKEILFIRDARIAGTTKWNYFKLFNLAIEGVCCFTTTPLRFATFAGMFVALLSFIFMLIIIIKKLSGVYVIDGYSSLMCVILFLGGIQLICIGIMGEYLARIFYETKNRPLYFINEYC